MNKHLTKLEIYPEWHRYPKVIHWDVLLTRNDGSKFSRIICLTEDFKFLAMKYENDECSMDKSIGKSKTFGGILWGIIKASVEDFDFTTQGLTFISIMIDELEEGQNLTFSVHYHSLKNTVTFKERKESHDPS